MKKIEIKEKSKDELEKLLEENQKKLLELRFQKSGGKVKNVMQLRGVRRDIARILTRIKEGEY